MMLVILAAAITYGAAAWLGVTLAEALYGKQLPFDDGPASVNVPSWMLPVAGAVLGAAIAIHGPSAEQLVTFGLVTVALSACTATDLRCGILPDLFTVLPLAGVVAWFAAHGNYGPLFSALLVAVPFAAVAGASRGRGMGWGDVKLAALGGALLGAKGAVLAFGVACISAFLLSRLPGKRRAPVAFGPCLTGGIGAILMAGASF